MHNTEASKTLLASKKSLMIYLRDFGTGRIIRDLTTICSTSHPKIVI